MKSVGEACRAIARRVIPFRVRLVLCRAANQAGEGRRDLKIASMRRKFCGLRRGACVRFLNYTVRINDGGTFLILCKDIFINRIHHFEAEQPVPFILDCGSNFGVSILYFKHVYPQARMIGFEPDSTIFPHLQENFVRNQLTDVKLVQAALAVRKATVT